MPRQKRFHIFYRLGVRDLPDDFTQIVIRLQSIGFGRLDQAEVDRTGSGSGRGIAKQPRFAPNGKGADRILGENVADIQLSVFAILKDIIIPQ